MNRRDILLGGTILPFLPNSAAAQSKDLPSTISLSASMVPIRSQEEAEFIYASTVTLMFLVGLVTEEPQKAIVEDRGTFFREYGEIIVDVKYREQVNGELLKNADRVQGSWTQIATAAQVLRVGLAMSVAPDILVQLIAGFGRTSAIATAHSEKGSSWWCDLYGLRKIMPSCG